MRKTIFLLVLTSCFNSCIYEKKNVSATKNSIENVIKRKIINRAIKPGLFVEESDTLISKIYQNGNYAIYHFGNSFSPHIPAHHHLIYYYNGKLMYTRNIRNLKANKRLLKKFEIENNLDQIDSLNFNLIVEKILNLARENTIIVPKGNW